MSAPIHTERQVRDLQVGDALFMGEGPAGVMSALVTGLEQVNFETHRISVLIQDVTSGQVQEMTEPIASNQTVGVL